MLASVVQVGAGQEVDRLHHPRRREVERRPAVQRRGRRLHLQPDEEVPGHRPLRAVDRRRPAERHRQRQHRSRWRSTSRPQPYFFNFANQVGIVPEAHLVHRRRRRAPGHLGGHEAGRHRPVQGQPVHAEQHPVHAPTRRTGSPASRTSRRSSTRPTWTTARRTSTWPAARRSGAASSSRTSSTFYLAKSRGQPHLVAADDERGAVPEPRSVPPGDQQARGPPGHRVRARPRPDLARSARAASSRRRTRPAS